jgi:hypothetical protein
MIHHDHHQLRDRIELPLQSREFWPQSLRSDWLEKKGLKKGERKRVATRTRS